MKKILAVLLAFALVGGAFAQVTTSVALDGVWTLVNQDLKAAGPYAGNTGATGLSLAAADEKATKGVDVSFGGMATTGNVTFSSFDAWLKLNDMVTIKFGNFGNYDFETTGYYKTDIGYFSQKNQLEAQISVAGASIYLDVPIGTAAGLLVDALETSEIFASYKIDQVGTVKAWAQLGLVTGGSNTFGGAFSLAAVDKLVFVVTGQYGSALTVGAWTQFTGVDNLRLRAEFYMSGSAFRVYGGVKYTLDPAMYVSSTVSYFSNSNYSASFQFAYTISGLMIGPKVAYGSTAATATAAALTWSVPLYYSVAF